MGQGARRRCGDRLNCRSAPFARGAGQPWGQLMMGRPLVWYRAVLIDPIQRFWPPHSIVTSDHGRNGGALVCHQGCKGASGGHSRPLALRSADQSFGTPFLTLKVPHDLRFMRCPRCNPRDLAPRRGCRRLLFDLRCGPERHHHLWSALALLGRCHLGG
jgi:hypothetical protein